jgi:hypothetical protein
MPLNAEQNCDEYHKDTQYPVLGFQERHGSVGDMALIRAIFSVPTSCLVTQADLYR